MTDAVDARVLGVVAEMGRAAVHEVAARLGMDPREVASRLVALSAAGVPLLVGVECDPNGVRAVLARMSGGVQGTPSGVYPPPGGYPQQFPPSGPHHVPTGPPSQPFPAQPYQQGYPQQQAPYGQFGGQPQHGQQAPQGHPGQGQPNPGQPGQGQQGLGQPVQGQGHGQPGPGSGQNQVMAPNYGQPGAQSQPVYVGPPSQPVPAAPEPISTWGPPQSSSWARGDQPSDAMDRTQPAVRPGSRQGVSGSTLETEGLEGERIAIQLVEVVDPADYLFTAAGYRLQEGERSIVVHTEMTNRGAVNFATLPDMYLVLVTPDGKTISKAPVSLSSRPAYRIGVAPGETAGGHTVYVVPEDTEVTSVRWSPRPDDESRTLTWKIEN
ncbi:AsnC family protein [Actinokineospora sp. HUAS TT18]|uniref:AsnC family protein n=1 Tax=Actinokineospora sp. HUAS TT18 TaxID=3447451 RepID=UPI003F51E72B